MAVKASTVEQKWHDCEELKPKPKEESVFACGKAAAKKHRTEWCTAGHKREMVWCMAATSRGCCGASFSVGRVAHGPRQHQDC